MDRTVHGIYRRKFKKQSHRTAIGAYAAFQKLVPPYPRAVKVVGEKNGRITERYYDNHYEPSKQYPLVSVGSPISSTNHTASRYAITYSLRDHQRSTLRVRMALPNRTMSNPSIAQRTRSSIARRASLISGYSGKPILNINPGF